MLTYKQKIRKPRGKVTMGNFDLYADLPPLSPVEEAEKPPTMSRSDIKTLQKHPYLAGSRRSSLAANSSSSNLSSVETWLPKFSADISEIGSDRKMMEVKRGVGFDMSHSKKANDCLEVLPQNTVPMAKYRKNYARKKLLKESAELEGTITDEEIWKRRKTQEEKERYAAVKRRQSGSGKSGVVEDKYHDLDDGYERMQEKRSLEEEIFRPTYVADADLEDESFFSAIGKSLPRRKIAVVSAVMQKVEKRKQEREERRLNEKIMAELNMIGDSADRRSSSTGDLKTPAAEIPDKEQPEAETDQRNPMESQSNESHTDHVEVEEGVIHATSTEQLTTQTNQKDEVAPSIEKPVERKESTNRPPRLHPVAKRPSFLQKMNHAKSEGDLVAALNASSFAPPDDFCDTGAMISYSEILMASAKHLEHTVSMIDISKPAVDVGTYVPQLADYAPRKKEPKTYILPPEIGEEIESQTSDVGYTSPEPVPMSPTPSERPTREPIYSKVRKKSHSRPQSAARRQSTNMSARRRMHRSHASSINNSGKKPKPRLERSASSGDLEMVHRLAAIVEKQGELMERWQKLEMARLSASNRSLNSASVNSAHFDFTPTTSMEEQVAPPVLHPRRPSLAPSLSVQSRDTYSDSSTNYELATFDDLTYASIGDVLLNPDPVRVEEAHRTTTPQLAQTSAPVPPQGSQLNTTKRPDPVKLATKPEKAKYHTSADEQHSKVQTPNGHVYNEREITRSGDDLAAPQKPSTRSITPKLKHPPKADLPRDRVASADRNTAKRKSSMPRKKSTRQEITREPSQVIKIDVIKSSGEVLDVQDGAAAPPGGTSASRSNSAVGVRRRRSLIRVQGIRNQRNEGAEELNEKIQSVIDAGTGMDGDGEGWWVAWAKREGGEKKSDSTIVRRVSSLFRRDNIEKRKEVDVVAELVQKLPGEEEFSYYETQPRIEEVREPVEVQRKRTPSPRVLIRRREASPKREASQKRKKTMKRAPSFDENVSDVPPLPPTLSKTTKRIQTQPVPPKKQPSFDSGVSTNLTDDDRGDVTPGSRDGRTTVPQKLAQPSANVEEAIAIHTADEKKEADEKNDVDQDNLASGDTTTREESILKKLANWFGISYEEPVEEPNENASPKPIPIFG